MNLLVKRLKRRGGIRRDILLHLVDAPSAIFTVVGAIRLDPVRSDPIRYYSRARKAMSRLSGTRSNAVLLTDVCVAVDHTPLRSCCGIKLRSGSQAKNTTHARKRQLPIVECIYVSWIARRKRRIRRCCHLMINECTTQAKSAVRTSGTAGADGEAVRRVHAIGGAGR